MKQLIHTSAAPAAIGPYNQATVYGGLVYLSGQIALDPQTAELRLDSIEVETRQVLANIAAVLEAAQSDWAQVLKCTIFLSDMAHYAEVNRIYAEVFPPEIAPARECVAVAGLPRGVNVEISLIAAVKPA